MPIDVDDDLNSFNVYTIIVNHLSTFSGYLQFMLLENEQTFMLHDTPVLKTLYMYIQISETTLFNVLL